MVWVWERQYLVGKMHLFLVFLFKTFFRENFERSSNALNFRSRPQNRVALNKMDKEGREDLPRFPVSIHSVVITEKK